MNYNTYKSRSPTLVRLDPQVGTWIYYKLRLAGYTQKDVSDRAGVQPAQVSKVLLGKKSSGKVYVAVAKMLGYRTMKEMLNEARRAI